MAKKLSKEIIDVIASQCIKEIDHERTYKSARIAEVQKNEDLIYGVKPEGDGRANVNLGRGDEFLETYLSKIISPLIFKYKKSKDSQLKRVNLINALSQTDRKKGMWDRKDRFGKGQAIVYGRAIYCYYASSENGKYSSHLENIDFYDFLIDSSAGGLDMEDAFYMGNYGVNLGRKELEDGIKSGYYLKDYTSQLLEGINNTEKTQEEQYQDRRNTLESKITELATTEKYKFWRWFTTYQGERYYCLLTNSGTPIKCCLMTELFSGTDDCPLGCWPYWSWATRDDLKEFWSKSPVDAAREIVYAETASINQMLDNAEAINKPQRKVQTGAIENLAELKYNPKNLLIKVKGDIDVNKAYQTVETPSIETPLKVYEILENILQKASGVTDGTAGVADEDGKVGIYEGNIQAVADRFKLISDRYTEGYERFGKLYQLGVKDNLTNKQAIDIVGPDGIETQEKVSGRDIFRKNETYIVMVEASDSEINKNTAQQKARITFLDSHAQDPVQNQKKAYELGAKAVGFSTDEVKELMDTSEFGDAELMSECSRDIENILDGKELKPNRRANNAYKQKMVDYAKDHYEDMTEKQFSDMEKYILSLAPIITENEVRQLSETVDNKMLELQNNTQINE